MKQLERVSRTVVFVMVVKIQSWLRVEVGEVWVQWSRWWRSMSSRRMVRFM